MQFIDLVTQQKRIRNKIEANIAAVLDHGKYIMGPEIKALEKKLSEYVGVKHAIGCASGTDALLIDLYRSSGRMSNALDTMERFVRRFPRAPQTEAYRADLARYRGQ